MQPAPPKRLYGQGRYVLPSLHFICSLRSPTEVRAPAAVDLIELELTAEDIPGQLIESGLPLIRAAGDEIRHALLQCAGVRRTHRAHNIIQRGHPAGHHLQIAA
jgi:hypothetical protein